MDHHYSHLNVEELRKIAKWLEANIPVAEMADRLGRDVSTISRDIKQNRYSAAESPDLNGYYAVAAQDMYKDRRSIHKKMAVPPQLKAIIEDRFKAGRRPTGCWLDAPGTASDLRDPRDDLPVRLFRG